MVNVEVLKVVVEVDAAGTKVATKKGGMCCEYSCNVNMALAAKGDREARLPLMKMGNHSGFLLPSDILAECVNKCAETEGNK